MFTRMKEAKQYIRHLKDSQIREVTMRMFVGIIACTSMYGDEFARSPDAVIMARACQFTATRIMPRENAAVEQTFRRIHIKDYLPCRPAKRTVIGSKRAAQPPVAVLTEPQLRAYAAHPEQCPFCRSLNIEGQAVQIQGNKASQQVYCRACENSWWDEYDRVGLVVGGPAAWFYAIAKAPGTD